MVLSSVSAPVKESNISCCRRVVSWLPSVMTLEPVDSIWHVSELRHYTRLDISTLISAPRYEAATPFHSTLEAIPGPDFFTTFVTNLLCSNLRNLGISNPIAIATIVIIYIFLPKSR